MKSALFLSLSLLLGACAPGNGPSMVTPGLSGVEFLPAQAEKGVLFRYYQPMAGSKWLNNWTSRFDLTGVSWNDARTATLISPSHVVMAAHFVRPSNVAVMFHDKRGKAYERYLTAVLPIANRDIAVGRLNLPLPPEVKFYRFASATEATVGRPVLITDQTRAVSIHRIEAMFSGTVRFGYLAGLNPIYQRNLVVGDSGNPSFLVKNGELLLLGTHSTGGPGAGPFYGDPQVQAAIRAAMAELGD